MYFVSLCWYCKQSTQYCTQQGLCRLLKYIWNKNSSACVHLHTHTHTHTHTCMHAHMRACAHTHTHTHKHAHWSKDRSVSFLIMYLTFKTFVPDTTDDQERTFSLCNTNLDFPHVYVSSFLILMWKEMSVCLCVCVCVYSCTSTRAFDSVCMYICAN